MAILPTPRLLVLAVGVAVLLALSTLTPELLYVAAAYVVVLVAMTIGDLNRSPVSAVFRVSRNYDERLSLAEANQVDLMVDWAGPHARRHVALRLWLRYETPSGIDVDHQVLEGSINSGDSWVGRYHLTPHRRGDYWFGAIKLRVE